MTEEGGQIPLDRRRRSNLCDMFSCSDLVSSYLNLLKLDEKYKSEEMRVVSSLSGSNRAKEKSLNQNVNLNQNQTQSLDQNQNQSLDQIKNQEENQGLRDKNQFQEILLTPSGINLL